MKDETHKRMAGDYEIIQAIHIGDREIVLGEKPLDERSRGIRKSNCFLSERHGFSHAVSCFIQFLF